MSDFRARLDKSISGQYEIERELGGGGMSRTYVANERALNRRVVIKVLSPELLAGVSVDRFNREVLLAARLQHPHIVPVLGAGDADGLPWFSMPYVEGESVRARLAQGPLSIGEVISILRDVARALAFAHANGVVHRDIKPDNILLSAGSATVTDFGIAKAISASRTAAPGATLTAIGTSIGTPAYMAPEQAAGDPNTDQRADYYSYGILAYELLTGRPPFYDMPPARLLAAQMSERPRDIRDVRPDTPTALATVVMRCLEKSPDDRPQTATDIVKVLDSVTSSSSSSAAPVILAGNQIRTRRALAIWAAATLIVALTAWAAQTVIGLPEWALPGSVGLMMLGLPLIFFTSYVQKTAYRAYTATPAFTPGGNTAAHGTMATLAIKASPHVSWRRTWLGGSIAVGAFAALVIGFMVMRAMGIGTVGSLMGKGKFGAKETIIVADFKGPANDPTLGGTVSEALRTDLAQSSNLKVLTKSGVAEILRLMQKPADAEVPFTLAREVASREGAKAVLDGEITQLGGSYVIAARLVAANDGSDLAQFRRTAKSQTELVEVLGALSKDIRSKVGESLKNVHESIALERVTTSSLPALRKYVEGVQLIAATGDNVKGRALLTEAVTLDSTFAMAWRRIASTYSNDAAGAAPAAAALDKAFRYRERLSENERLLTEASYYASGPAPDLDRAITSYESLIERDSLNRSALNNVAILYVRKREYAKAEDRFRRATFVPTPFGASFTGLIEAQLFNHEIAAAESTLVRFTKTFPAHPDLIAARAWISYREGKNAEVDSVLRLGMSGAKGAVARVNAVYTAGNLAILHGKLSEGLRLESQSVPEDAPEIEKRGIRLAVMIDSAWIRSYLLADTVGAKTIIRRALAAIPIESMAPVDRPWTSLAAVAWATGDVAAVRNYAAMADRDLLHARMAKKGMSDGMRALVAMTEGKYKDAANLFAVADKADLGPADIGPLRAQALDLANQPDSAIVEYERFAMLTIADLTQERDHVAGTHRRLGELYDAKGNTAKALEHYEKFVELWKNADPELQPKVKAARARIEDLRRKGSKG